VAKVFRKFNAAAAVIYMCRKRQYRITIHYLPNSICELTRLCELHGSDKGGNPEVSHPYPWPPHSYSEFYSRKFDVIRTKVRAVFECGIGSNNASIPSSMGYGGKPGASLRVWRDYFPNATIVGADIDTRILFSENRICTHYVNQLDITSIENMWKTIEISEFDLMIDDGLHTFEAGTNLFLKSVSRLRLGGIYVIEDVPPRDLRKYEEFFGDTNFAVEYVTFRDRTRRHGEQSLIVVSTR